MSSKFFVISEYFFFQIGHHQPLAKAFLGTVEAYPSLVSLAAAVSSVSIIKVLGFFSRPGCYHSVGIPYQSPIGYGKLHSHYLFF